VFSHDREIVVFGRDVPIFLSLHTTNPPAIMTDAPLSQFKYAPSLWSVFIDNSGILRHSDGFKSVEVALKLSDRDIFFRMIAKICYAYFKCYFNDSEFSQVLGKIIIGEKSGVCSRVGNIESAKEESDFIWRIAFNPIHSYLRRKYLAVWFELFGIFGGPTYVTIVDEWREEYEIINEIPITVSRCRFVQAR